MELRAQKTQALSEEDLKTWWQKDIEKDTIPGVSLDRAYSELLKTKNGKEVIVAVLDTKIDINHEDLKNQIWINTDEIPDNGIDDDDNGYVDDINGWNFLGTADGQDVVYQLPEEIRFLNKYDSIFSNKELSNIPENQKSLFSQYDSLNKNFISAREHMLKMQKSSDSVRLLYYEGKNEFRKIFKDTLVTNERLDSIGPLYPTFKNHIALYREVVEYGIEDEDIEYSQTYFSNNLRYNLNKEYDERELLNDNPDKLEDTAYGNNNLINNLLDFQHSTPVSGVLAAKRGNEIGINGFSNNIKVMPVVMVAEGDEHDKEVSRAIRYAVDNGADIINMSWGKNQSIHVEWVREAFRYAAQKNVLLISAGGNDSRNIDLQYYYPNDFENGNEFVDNFIMVGATTHSVDSTFVASFSNYGQKQIDVFAPGDSIYTTQINNTYESTGGTSFSCPITSGVAALIKSYYPTLTASEIKSIILESGTTYDIEVNVTQKEKKSTLRPFSQLSKSGKVVNAYNALMMAEVIVNSKD